MKKIIALCALSGALTSEAIAGSMTTLSRPFADTSFLYIYRGGQFGGALSNFSIWVDDTKLCKISNGKYIKVRLSPGTHKVEAKVGGVGVMKKTTSIEVDVVKGKSNFVACNMKQSITRVRMEMTEVIEKSGQKEIDKMSLDNCQDRIDD